MHEINLLPPARRQTLRREVTINSLLYTLASFWYALIIITACGAVLGVGLWAYTWRLEAAGQTQVTATVTEYQQLRDQIAEQNLLLEYVQGLDSNRLAWAEFLTDFLATVPPGIEIGGLTGSSVVRGNTISDVIFTLNGQAAVRGGLIIFADRLRLLTGVTAVEAPNSNLIKRENPLYRFTLQLDPSVLRHEKNTAIQPSL